MPACNTPDWIHSWWLLGRWTNVIIQRHLWVLPLVRIFVDDATMCLKIGDTPKACIFASDHSPVDGMGVPKFPNKPIAFYVAIYHHLPGMRKYRMVLRMISCWPTSWEHRTGFTLSNSSMAQGKTRTPRTLDVSWWLEHLVLCYSLFCG